MSHQRKDSCWCKLPDCNASLGITLIFIVEPAEESVCGSLIRGKEGSIGRASHDGGIPAPRKGV